MTICPQAIAFRKFFSVERCYADVSFFQLRGLRGPDKQRLASNFNQLDITSTNESKGVVRPELAGRINFNNVHSLPGRPEAPVLMNIDLSINDGECITIIGPSGSGSGKSMLAAVFQRLDEPTNGTITISFNGLQYRDQPPPCLPP